MSSDIDDANDNIPSIDGRFSLRVSRDKSSIAIDRLSPPSGGGKAVTTELINAKLQNLAKSEKIKRIEGVKKDVVEAAICAAMAGTPLEEPVIIVEGIAPEYGEDAEIVWHVDIGGDSGAEAHEGIVFPQQLLATRKAATAGLPGKDVFGKEKRTRPGIEKKLVAGDGVSASPVDGLTEYRAEHWGRAEFSDDTIKVSAPGLEISDDRLSAYLDLYSDPSSTYSKQALVEFIIERLKHHKITYGVNTESIAAGLIQAASQENNVVRRVLVASGAEPIAGEDAVVEYYIDRDADNEDNRIVFPDQLLVRFTRATAGTPGSDVFSTEIPAIPGADMALSAGDNIIIKQTENCSEYYAVSIGYAGLNDHNLEVVDLPINVSADGLVARMDIFSHSCGAYKCPLLAEHVIKHASKMGIKFGIDEVGIEALLSQAGTLESGHIRQAAIAHGLSPVTGHPSRIKWYVDIEDNDPYANLVLHNQIIAGHMLATSGTPGQDVYGKEIAAQAGHEVGLEKGEGIFTRLVEGVEILVSELMGNVVYAEGKLSVHKHAVVISADSMTATMDIPMKSSGQYGKRVSASDIVTLLASDNITHGIDIEVIKGYLAQLAQAGDGLLTQVIVARGTPAIHGADAVINWEFDIHSEQEGDRVVVPGQLIATHNPPTPGTPGKRIDGQVLTPEAGEDSPLHAGQWVEQSTTENGEEYRSTCMGILELDNSILSIHPSSLQIIDDGLEATMDLYAISGGNHPQQVTIEQVLDLLGKSGITYGINGVLIRETLALALLRKEIGGACVVHDVIVAAGRDKRDGIPAHIEISHTFAPSVVLSHGRLDLHELGYPWDVHKDMHLGIFRQAMMAEDGITVTGVVIPAKQVVETALTLSNIAINDNGELVSESDGVFLFNGFNLMVTDQVIIDKDVDLHTGNIHTESSVHIKGHVTHGFIVEADGDIIIDQNIENATVRSKGNVLVHGGIRGTHTQIHAGGNISARFVEYAHLIARNNIEITQSSVDAHLTAGNSIYIGPEPGALITSHCTATGVVMAKTIGHPASDPSEIKLGISAEQHSRLLELRSKDGLTDMQMEAKNYLESLATLSEQSALRVQGAIHSDVILHIGHGSLAIKGDTSSCKDYYLDPDNLRITSRLHDPKSPIPAIHHTKLYSEDDSDGGIDEGTNPGNV